MVSESALFTPLFQGKEISLRSLGWQDVGEDEEEGVGGDVSRVRNRIGPFSLRLQPSPSVRASRPSARRRRRQVIPPASHLAAFLLPLPIPNHILASDLGPPLAPCPV